MIPNMAYSTTKIDMIPSMAYSTTRVDMIPSMACSTTKVEKISWLPSRKWESHDPAAGAA